MQVICLHFTWGGEYLFSPAKVCVNINVQVFPCNDYHQHSQTGTQTM